MKTSLLKLFVVMTVMLTFGLKASCPPIPEVTSITITSFPDHYYSVMVSINGYELPYYTEYTDWDYSASTGNFSADHMFAHNTQDQAYVTVSVYVKEFWNSPYYVAIGSVASWEAGVTRTMDGNNLTNLTFPSSMLDMEEEEGRD